MRRIVKLSVVAILSCMITSGVAMGESLKIRPGPMFKGKDKDGPMAKVGFALGSLHQEYQAYVKQKGNDKGFKPSNLLLPVVGNRVVIDAVASGDAGVLKSDLKGLGLQKASSFGRTVSGQLPIGAIKGMAGLGSLKFVRPAYAMTRAGLVTSQGDVAMHSDDARATFGVDGSGITVGVLSDSFNQLGGEVADVGTGDLPAGTVVLDDTAVCGLFAPCSDEGRAMMQLIHDVAPGADQAFHTAFNGQADFASGIIELATVAGAQVIVDDVIYLAEPMFQDGIIARAVDTVVNTHGASYFSSAGNAYRSAYEGEFRHSGTLLEVGGFPSGELHDFNPGPPVDIAQRIDVPVGSGFIMSFQWDQPYFSVSGDPGSTSDIDIYLTDSRNRFILASSTENNLSGDPVELLQFINFGFGNRFNILIANFTGPAPGLMKYVRFDLGPGVVIREFKTDSGTIYGHANATWAEAVGAAFYGDTPEFGIDPPLLESFSSAGPTPIFFETDGTPKEPPEVRQKPEIVAPDGTNTTFFGSDTDGDGFPNFFGTSAAAPHAAAAAALMLEANPALAPTEVYTALQSTTIDMDAPGFDFDSGFGFIQADAAVASVAGPPPPDTTGAIVTAVDPVNDATSVPVTSDVAVTFSEPVDPTTVNSTTFTVNNGLANIAGAITVAADGLSASFDPDANLANQTTYTVTVTSGVTDTSGNALDQDGANGNQDFTSSFTTVVAPAGNANDMYVWDIVFQSRTRGRGGAMHDERILVTIRRDSDADGASGATDEPVSNASVTVVLTGPVSGTFTGITNGDGEFRTGWLMDLPVGTYTAEVTVLTHTTFNWNHILDPPDQQHTIPH